MFRPPVELHYSNRACFPLIPYLPPDVPTFNEAYGLGDDFLFSSLDYENACDSSTVRSLIGPMMGGLSSVGFIAGPYGSILRFAEGIDSIRNLAATGSSNTTEAHRAAAIVCGIAQLGGVIWIALVLVFTGALCVCAPLGSVCCLKCFRFIRGASRKDRQREEAIDDLIAAQQELIDVGMIAPSSGKKRKDVMKRVKVSVDERHTFMKLPQVSTV